MRNDFRLRSVLAAIVVAVGLATASPGRLRSHSHLIQPPAP